MGKSTINIYKWSFSIAMLVITRGFPIGKPPNHGQTGPPPGDFFSDPGAAGLTCAKSGPVKIAADVKANKEGEDVFTEVSKRETRGRTESKRSMMIMMIHGFSMGFNRSFWDLRFLHMCSKKSS